jgi:hypothetical protein
LSTIYELVATLVAGWAQQLSEQGHAGYAHPERAYFIPAQTPDNSSTTTGMMLT